ncbi:MAG: hypothetical protein EB059_01870 [Alphaproteobacteria bacterium]|nr:hypothetical protein [Alphaproteobacteria bacterium]
MDWRYSPDEATRYEQQAVAMASAFSYPAPVQGSLFMPNDGTRRSAIDPELPYVLANEESLEHIKNMQKALEELGLYKGVDGKMGPRTSAALDRYNAALNQYGPDVFADRRMHVIARLQGGSVGHGLSAGQQNAMEGSRQDISPEAQARALQGGGPSENSRLPNQDFSPESQPRALQGDTPPSLSRAPDQDFSPESQPFVLQAKEGEKEKISPLMSSRPG